MACTRIALLALGLAALALAHDHDHNHDHDHVVKHEIHTICVPTTVIEPCEHMSREAGKVGMALQCLPARDRIDCLYKVRDHKADFQAAEPEDIYVASMLDNSKFKTIMEIRSQDEPKAEYRYEAVAVVHKDLDINNVKALKGLKSCHTGIGRNAGYKIPITKLTKMGILGPLSDTLLSPRENELKALSKFFSKGCLVGKWSPHPETNDRLKKTYSNLCEMCEDPLKCDYPDEHSGYEGALRCLANGGDVAFTKVIFVKKFFGMPYGQQPAKPSEHNPEDYAYFCPDGSKRPITGPPCTWAARPWPAYISSNHDTPAQIKELTQEIVKLNNLGQSEHAEWIAKVLLLNNKTLAVENKPLSPLQYLEKAQYKDVIERDVLEPRRVVRVCVETDIEMEKCELLKSAAYSRDIRPSLSCVKSDDCIVSLSERKAEVYVADSHRAIGSENQHIMPLLGESYNGDSKQYVGAVVKKDSGMTTFSSLKGKRACIFTKDTAYYWGIVRSLQENGLLEKRPCPDKPDFTKFFSSVDESSDPMKCLNEGRGDVAFVPLSNQYREEEYSVVCPETGKTESVGHTGCSLVSVPPRMVLYNSDLTEVQVDEARQSLIAAGELYGKNPQLFRLFGDFKDTPNVIFSNHATRLSDAKESLAAFENYKKLLGKYPHAPECKAQQ